jgi:hypothetical protein
MMKQNQGKVCPCELGRARAREAKSATAIEVSIFQPKVPWYLRDFLSFDVDDDESGAHVPEPNPLTGSDESGKPTTRHTKIPSADTVAAALSMSSLVFFSARAIPAV